MKSILLSFSLRFAGGVLRRMKSRTRVALNKIIGRLRSVLDSRYAVQPRQTQGTRTEKPSPVRERVPSEKQPAGRRRGRKKTYQCPL